MSTPKKSSGKFSLEDIENRISRKLSEVVPIRMELTPDPRPHTTRAKSTGGKKRKAPDSQPVSLFDGKDPFEVEKQLHAVLGMGMEAVKNNFSVAEEEAIDLESELVKTNNKVVTLARKLAKEKKKVKAQGEKLEELKANHQSELTATVEDAKDSALMAVLQAKIKMAKEAMDPVFDRTKWDVESWQKAAGVDAEEDPLAEQQLVTAEASGAPGEKAKMMSLFD